MMKYFKYNNFVTQHVSSVAAIKNYDKSTILNV